MNRICFIIILILIFSKANSQELDYVITIQMDTIYGKKLKGLNNKGLRSVAFKNNKKVKYGPNEIIAYYIAKGKRYMERVPSPFSWDKPGQLTFIHRLTNGKIKLYIELGDNQFPTKYYITKDNLSLSYLPTGRIKFAIDATYANLNHYFYDYPEVSKELMANKLKSKNLIELINKYNNFYIE